MNEMADNSDKSWYLARRSEKLGSYSSRELAAMGKAGEITSDMVVWRQGMATWQPVAKVRGLQVIAVPAAPPPQPAVTVAVTPAAASAPMPVTGHVTIEKTKKVLKLEQLLGLACIVIGLMVVGLDVGSRPPDSDGASTAAMVGSLLFVVGIIWRIVTRMRIWWHHG